MVFYGVRIIFAFALLALTTPCHAQETAYQALNAVGKVKGDTFLDTLLSMEGVEGNSQPETWKMVFEDRTTRGGFREIEVRDGEIISQRSPTKSPLGSGDRIDLNRLQLDSDGAFTVATQSANRDRVRFKSASYILEAQNESGAPAWRVNLLDASGNSDESVRISADTGRVIGKDQNRERDAETIVETQDSRETVTRSENNGESTELKIHRTAVRTGRTISNGVKRMGGSIQEIFTGRRTIDRDLPE